MCRGVDLVKRPPSFLDLRAGEGRQMTHEETEAFISLTVADHRDKSALRVDDPRFEDADSFELAARRAIVGRLARAGVSVTVPAFVAMVILSERLGDLVLWAYLAMEIARRDGLDVVDLDALSFAMPHGIPTEEARRRIWDAQKDFDGLNGNWLDTVAAWTMEVSV